MYYYAPDENRKGKLSGLAASVCFLVLFLSISFLVSFRIDYEPRSEGILVDFGDDSEGSGEDNVALAQLEEPFSSTAAASEEYMTQETEEAPALPDSSGERSPDSRNAGIDANRDQPNPSETQVREVNRRALFPGRSTASDAVAQGASGDTKGNAGREEGGDGSQAAQGTGTEGISFDLSGRRPIGSLPRPGYDSNDAQGIVIIEITVDSRGRVQTAAFRPHGSTTQDTRLLEAALKAARQAKFTPSESDALQTGSITYVFRLQ